MTGWKTLTGGLGFTLVGIYHFLTGEVNTAIENILVGLSILGIGHKLDKLNNAR